MTSFHALSLEDTCIVQVLFFAALLFLVLYTVAGFLNKTERWWNTIHGRTLGWLAIGVLGFLLQTMLVYWHWERPDVHADAKQWITTQFLLLLPLAFLVMCWQLTRLYIWPRHQSLHGTKRERQSSR